MEVAEPPRPLRRPVRPRSTAPVAPVSLKPVPEPQESLPPPFELPPPKLVGLSESEAVGLLGEPQARQEWAPARLWVYRAPDCELELSFFFDVSRNGFYILDVAARDSKGESDNRERCLRSLQDDRRSR